MRSNHANDDVLVSVVWKRLFMGFCALCLLAGAAAAVYKFTDIRYYMGVFI